MTNKLHDKVKSLIYKTTEYHFSTVDSKVIGKNFPANVMFTHLSYLLNGTHKFIGDPGWGKTTLAQVVSTLCSGLPFDLYESLMMSGNPDVFEEKWIGRPDYAELVSGKESVIWQGCFGLDALLIDEGNRVPAGTQAEVLEGIRTGRWRYLNSQWYEGKKPTFLTVNYQDEGNSALIPPLEDRVDVVTEERPVSVTSDYLSAAKDIREQLCDQKIVTKVLDALNKKNYDLFKQLLAKERREVYLSQKDKEQILVEVEEKEWTNDAHYFLWAFAAEINHSEKNGVKRSCDPVSDHTHDKKFAGVNVKRSFSARPMMAARLYSSALAWVLGHDKVELDHVRYVIPYISAHKLGFSEAYINAAGNEERTDYRDLHLAKKLVTEVYGRYDSCVKPLKNLIHDIQEGKADPSKLKSKEHDHPLLKDIIRKRFETPKMNF